MTTTITWDGTATAKSSISHGGNTQGTISLLRRELVIQPDGTALHVPVISGNGLRGRFRRIGEELLRDTLNYEGKLSLTAAHALRAGGALAKVAGEPLSGSRLARLRALIPQVGVFGCAAGGRILDSSLRVSKLIPHVTETAHIIDHPSTISAFSLTQLESYAHQDESDAHSFHEVLHVDTVRLDSSGAPILDDLTGDQMMFRVETFPIGTRFDATIQLDRATDLEQAFFADVLAEFNARGRVGGRAGIGHGRLRLDLTPTAPPATIEWRAFLVDNHAEALQALDLLT
jgi:hypothetical protein